MNTSASANLSLPANGCTYTYLAVAEASVASATFPAALAVGFSPGSAFAAAGTSDSPVGSVALSTPASVQFAGIGVSIVLSEAVNETSVSGTGLNVSVDAARNTFYEIVAVGYGVALPITASTGFALDAAVGGPVGVAGIIVTGAVGTGVHTLSLAFTPSSSGGGGSESVSFVVFEGVPPPMDWDYAPTSLPNGSLGRVGGEGSGLAVDPAHHAVLVFGGATATGLSDATLLQNTTSGRWTEVAPTGGAPSARSNFSLIDLGGEAVLFGGLVDLSSGQCANDTWLFSFATDRWTNVTLPRAPPPREEAAGAADAAASPSFALIEGGFDPALPLRGGLATVYWNDTWWFNGSSHAWSAVSKAKAPAPAAAASMVFVPPLNGFVLYGGCAKHCSNGTWILRPGAWRWSVLLTTGAVPPPAVGGAATAWDSIEGAVVTFGGFELSQGTPVPTNGTLALSVPRLVWGSIAASGFAPTPRYLAASGWLSDAICPGLEVIGGNLVAAGFAPDRYLLDSSSTSESANDSSGGVCGADPVPVPTVVPTELAIHVLTTERTSIANATVTLSQPLPVPRGAITDLAGWANFTGVPAGAIVTNASAVGYGPNSTVVHVVLGVVTILNITLDRFGRLQLEVDGIGFAGVTYPIDLAYVRVDAVTDPGTVYSNVTDPNGTTSFRVPGARTYAFNIAAYSFENATSGSGSYPLVEVPENRTNSTNVLLVPLPGASITVFVRDADTGRPVPTANVTFTLPLPAHPAVVFGTWPVDPNGSRFLDPVPPATYRIDAAASGYQPNSTAVRVLISGPPETATIYLTPNQTEGSYCGPFITPCPGWGTPNPGLNAPFGSPASLASSTFWAFVAVPIALVAMGLVEALLLRRKSREGPVRTAPGVVP